jgi:adenylate kinase family enzyme
MSADFPVPPRVVVVGTSSAGKSTLAIRLACALGVERIELDALYWAPGWKPKSAEEFVSLVTAATSADAWVADGNYGATRQIVWSRANAIVWLNYSLATVLWRGFRRSVSRAIARNELWHGNRESFRRTFLSRESILVWIATTHRRRTRELRRLRESNQYPHLSWHEFTSPRQADDWLQSHERCSSLARAEILFKPQSHRDTEIK